MRLTLTDAQLMEDKAARGSWPIRIAMAADMEYPGKVTIRAQVADHHQGGACLPAALTADTLDALRAKLPDKLTRRHRTSLQPADVFESWGQTDWSWLSATAPVKYCIDAANRPSCPSELTA